MCTNCLRSITSVVASYKYNKQFFGVNIFNPPKKKKKKSAKIKCLLFSPNPQKFHTAEITGYTVLLTTLELT
jgi:hypothetical protein